MPSTNFKPPSNVISEGFRFHQRDQWSGESVTEILAELCWLCVLLYIHEPINCQKWTFSCNMLYGMGAAVLLQARYKYLTCARNFPFCHYNECDYGTYALGLNCAKDHWQVVYIILIADFWIPQYICVYQKPIIADHF